MYIINICSFLDRRAPEIRHFKTTVEKTHLRLNCYAFSNPPPSVTLLKDGVPVDIDPFKLVESTLFQKQIDNPDAKDVGIYTCKAENEFGVDVKYLTVTAEGKIILSYL